MRSVRRIALVVVGTMVAFGVHAAVAGPNGGSETGKRITQVKTKYSEVLVGTFSGWTPVTSMSMTVPAGTHAIIDVRLNAYGYCSGNASTTGSCLLRIKVGDKVAKPSARSTGGRSRSRSRSPRPARGSPSKTPATATVRKANG